MSGLTRFSLLKRSFSKVSMRPDLNKVTLMGRVGHDPFRREIGDKVVYSYTLATSDIKNDKEGNLVKLTQWHRISAWTKAESFARVKRGDLVYVEGSLRYAEYTDKQGVAKTTAEIHQTDFKLIAAKKTDTEETETEE